MISLDEVFALEQRALKAWPAFETMTVGGWLFRFAGGYTKRANSANALRPAGSFQDVKTAAPPGILCETGVANDFPDLAARPT